MVKLVITEKPSVAQSISKVIGASFRHDGYLEGNGYIVSWCIGHLVESAPPESYGDFAKWRKEDLPILPLQWQYRVTSATKKQFSVLKELLNSSDVDTVICATDAGREGELIFRLVYHQAQCRKPVQRLWISSMEDSAIKDGFAHLKPSTEYDALYEAALCRERADWLVGINATRLFSCLYGQPLNIGRVMTPTLGMAVQREAAISAFVSEPFFTVELEMNGAGAVSQRLSDKKTAAALKTACEEAQHMKIQKIQRTEKAENPPALYDLTTLQRDANRILGFTAQQTLDYTQSLYEKKLVTYPRTDSRYLTEDMERSLPMLIGSVRQLYEIASFEVYPRQVINSKKVSDHHAIIPTQVAGTMDISTLPKGEQAVLRLISARLLIAVSEAHRYTETVINAECAGEVFTAKGKVVTQMGWKTLEQQFFPAKENKEEPTLPAISEAVSLPIQKATIKEGKTTPPKHFTEDLLLQAMEAASADEFPKDCERKGIGTPATRASTIEKLVQKGYLQRTGSGKVKNLIPTDKGESLITVVPEQLQSPSMTADWEEKLMMIEHGEYSPDSFMEEIQTLVTDLVTNYEIMEGASTLMNRNTVIGNCPHCGAEVREKEKGWFCANRECRFILWKDNAYFNRLGKHLTGQMAERLVREGRLRLKDCKSQKTGKTYNAVALLSTEADGRPHFELQFENGGR